MSKKKIQNIILVYVFLVVITVFFLFFFQNQVATFDAYIGKQVDAIRVPALLGVWYAIAMLGKWYVVTSIAIICSVWWVYNKHLRAFIVPFLMTLIGSSVTVWIIKNLVNRPRPQGFAEMYGEETFSFPSGHSAAAIALYGFLAIVAPKVLKDFKLLRRISIFAVILIPFSRVYLGVHFFSDVVAGVLVGAGWLLIGIAFSITRINVVKVD